MKTLLHKTAIITGAAHGVGKALSAILAKRKCHLALVDLDESALHRQTLEIRVPDLRISAHVGDIGNPEQVKRIFGEIIQAHTNIGLLFNCAGVSVLGPHADTPIGNIQWIMDTNLLGTMLLCREAIPFLKQTGQGHIVNVASAAALLGMPGKAAYSASKAGVKAFSESLRAELHPDRIGVTCAFLGPVKTDMLSRSRVSDESIRSHTHRYLQAKGISPEQAAAQIIRAVEQNRARALISAESKALDILIRIFPSWLPALLTRFPRLLPA